MSMIEGCWANVLDNCERRPGSTDDLTGEHLMSVAIFAAADGMPNNRSGRVGRVVTVRGGHHLADGPVPVGELTADILCFHHNNSTSPLDEEGGRFVRAIENWNRVNAERGSQPPQTWPQQVFGVNGPLLERLFLKLAVNSMFGDGGLPIGGPDARAGWPTRELVEMVYGRRAVGKPAGLFFLARVGQQMDFEERFVPIHFDNGRYREGCVWIFRTLVIGVQFTPDPMPARMFDAVPALRGMTRLQPFRGINSASNVELRLNWPG
ncbi:MAG: hypothetical protein KF773_16845 [Deltaproteobacteria bacterium]|nr:hypothetical protein [Deltaproteobacteria bacterium]